MKHLALALAIISLLAISCADRYSIAGTSSQSVLDGKMAYIKILENNVFRTIDSCQVLHGQFRMSGQIDSIMCVSLFMGDANCLPIVLEQGDVRVNIANSSIRLEGTPLNDRLYTFLNSRDSIMMMLSQLPKKESDMIINGYTEAEVEAELGSQAAELRTALDRLETTFIVDNFDNVLGVTWFLELCYDTYHRFGYATTTPQIDEIYGKAPEDFKSNKEVVEFMKLVNKIP